MKKLFLFAILILSLSSTSFSQDTVDFFREKEIKQILKKFEEQQSLIDVSTRTHNERQKSKSRNTKKKSKYNLEENNSNHDKRYNFNLSDAFGGIDLSQDQVVQKALAAEEKRASQETLSSTSITKPTVEFGDFEETQKSSTGNSRLIIGIILIIIGVIIWSSYAKDYSKGKMDITHSRRIHDSPLGCIPWVIAFSLIISGLYLLFKS